jgi:hypothetical protein
VTVADVFNTFAVNLLAAVRDDAVWHAVAICLAAATLVFALGYRLARLVGILDTEAQDSEVLAVGLGVGLVASILAWAAVASGGRSAFTVPALAILAAAAIALRRSSTRFEPGEPARVLVEPRSRGLRLPLRLTTVLTAGAFLVAVGLTYAATMTPSQRDGMQPIEFIDEAYYSMLGDDLARTGTESIYAHSAIETAGFPSQTWYHWGEMWFAAAVISTAGLEPLPARHLVALPIILLAMAVLTGSLARRLNGTRSRAALLFAGGCTLFLAPFPIPASFFAYWARGNLFGVTMYGLALVLILLLALALVVNRFKATPALLLFISGVTAALIPAHIILAGLTGIGTIGAVAIWLAGRVRSGGTRPAVDSSTRLLVLIILSVSAATVGWGVVTGHRIGASGLVAGIAPFGSAWRDGVLAATFASGLFLSIPPVLWFRRRMPDLLFWFGIGIVAIYAFGALAWGARLGDYTMFHVFFGGIAAFATPMAVAATVALARRIRKNDLPRVRLILIVLTVAQLEIGVFTTVLRLEEFGPRAHDDVPAAILERIRNLPSSAVLAYACQPKEELGYWSPRLGAIEAHTRRRILPICFQAEALTSSIQESAADVPAQAFAGSAMSAIYPTSASRPSSAEVAAFMKQHGIAYIYADPRHPNTLVENAIPVLTVGEFELLRIE